MTDEQKHSIFGEAAGWLARCRVERARGEGRCMFWAAVGLHLLYLAGVRDACIQAGSMSWQRLPDSQRNYPDAAFGYVWGEADTPEVFPVPEVHVWLGVPSTQELIDFSTGDLVDVCREMLGLPWPGRRPPPFVWGRASELPSGVHYHPYPDATIWAGKRMTPLIAAMRVGGISRAIHLGLTTGAFDAVSAGKA